MISFKLIPVNFIKKVQEKRWPNKEDIIIENERIITETKGDKKRYEKSTKKQQQRLWRVNECQLILSHKRHEKKTRRKQ